MRFPISFVAASTLVLLATTAIGHPNPAIRLEHRSVENTADLEPRMIRFGSFEEGVALPEQGSKSTPQSTSGVQPPQGSAQGSSSGGEQKMKKKSTHRGAASRERHVKKHSAKYFAKQMARTEQNAALAAQRSARGGGGQPRQSTNPLESEMPFHTPSPTSGSNPSLHRPGSGVPGTATASRHYRPPHATTYVPQPPAHQRPPAKLPSLTGQNTTSGSGSKLNPHARAWGEPKSTLNPNASSFFPQGRSGPGSGSGQGSGLFGQGPKS